MNQLLSLKQNNNEEYKIILNQPLSPPFDIFSFLIKEMREDPEIIYLIYKNASIDVIIKNFSNLFIDNFFENLLVSVNNVEDELLSLIYRALNDEFSSISSLSDFDKFLKNSKCGYLLNEIVNKYEVRLFFQNTLKPIISQLIIKRNEKWSFNIELIKNFINENSEEKDGTTIYEKEQKNIFNTLRNNFYKNYLSSLDDKYLENYKNQCENNIIIEYCNKQLNENDSNKKFVSSSHFIELIYKEDNAEEILNFYIKCFMSVQKILISIFKKLSDNSQAMPHIIRCVCKMIKCLVKKKFPNVFTMDIYKFVAKFFFKIFNRYLKTFDTEIFIDLIIDQQITEKINIITVLINMIIKGDLFNNKSTINYIPFNWCLIKELMPLFYEFFEKLTNFQFSPYIEKLISGVIENDNMIYDYFVENPDKHFRYFNICLTVADYVEILNILIKLKTDNPDIFKLNENYLKNYDEKTVKNIISKREKIIGYIDKYKRIPDNVDEIKEKMDQGKVKTYYLLKYDVYSREFEEKKKILSKKDKLIFYTENSEIGEGNIQNLIINFENYLSHVLYNDKHISNINSQKRDIINLFNESMNYLKNTISLEKIKPYWYAQTLIALAENINESEIKIDDILNEMKNKLKKSINDFDNAISISSEILNRMKNLNKMKNSYNYILKSIEEIKINKELVKISEKEFKIKLAIDFKIKDKKFKIYEVSIPEEKKIIEKNKLKITNDFQSFINEFPKLNKRLLQEDDYFETLKEMQVSKEIQKIQKIFNELIKKYKPSHEEVDQEMLHLIRNTLLTESNIENTEEFKKIQNEIENLSKTDSKINKQDSVDKIASYTKKIINIFNKIIIREEEIRKENKELEKYREKLYTKVNDLIFQKLHEKIYPLEQNHDDIKINQRCILLSWIQPHHIMEENYLIHDDFFTDIVNFIIQIDSERTPRKKIEAFNKLNNYIIETIAFNKGNKNIDENELFPVFIYAIIKAKPLKMMTNIIYMDFFLDQKVSETNKLLESLKKIINTLIKFTYKNLKGVTQEEFTKKCEEAVSS